MKNLVFTFLMLSLLSCRILFSQPFFGSVTDIYLNPPPPSQSGYIYFGLESINTNLLDVDVIRSGDNYRIGQWNNNLGDGNFSQTPGTINMSTDGSSGFIGERYIKLRPVSPLKDIVISRLDRMEVYKNENGIIYQGNVPASFYTNPDQFYDIEPGTFYAPHLEDVLVSDESTNLKIFRNWGNGSLGNEQDININNSHIYNFKLKQLNQKGEGYIQDNPDDRSDIVFVDKSLGLQHHHVYAFCNDNNGGFNTQQPFASFDSDIGSITDLEVGDVDGDGYNDLIIAGMQGTCPTAQMLARVYFNWHGQYINENTQIWSYGSEYISCGCRPRIMLVDLNKDGFKDLVFVRDWSNAQIKVLVFINQHSSPIFSQDPLMYVTPEADEPHFFQVITADIYGSENQDGGGNALLISYTTSGSGSSTDFHIKVLNAFTHDMPPPPPVVQGLLEPISGNLYHPHLHLDYRGERDFDHCIIYRLMVGGTEDVMESNFSDTGWTDYSKYVDLSGHDYNVYNCHYYAKSIDKGNKESINSQHALYIVNTPSCEGCGGDSPLNNVNTINITTPDKFKITNYPNPFNPKTRIKFDLPITCHVTVMIYDILGREVSNVVNEVKLAGSYEAEFDGSNLTSGIYFYKFEAGDYVQTRKLVLIK